MSRETRLLVLGPTSRDTRLACGFLRVAGMDAEACSHLGDVCRRAVDGAAALVVPDETLLDGADLKALLAAQPAWSDLPVLVLVGAQGAPKGSRALGLVGRVTLLDRPLRVGALVSAAQSALRARLRQYEIRDLLEERERVVAALASSEARYRAVGETIPFGAWAADPNGRLTFVSVAFLHFLGADAEEIQRHGTWHHRLPPQDARRAAQDWRRAIEDGRQFGLEYDVPGAEGDLRSVLVRGVPLRDPDGAVTGWVGIHLDVTDRRRLEDEMSRVGRLESIAVLASGIAHDFNNILTALIVNVALARRLLPAEDRVTVRLDAALRAGDHAQTVVRQLLTFARGGAPVRRPADLRLLVDEAVAFALQGSGTGAEVRYAEDLSTVSVDAGQIVQVVQNLVINAAHASGGVGSVTVDARNVEVREGSTLPLRPGRYVTLTITDQGVGIAPEDLPRVFDPFFTRRTGGSGLGLSTAHSIVQRHDGHITLRSQLGRGTTAQFYLPASVEDPVDLTGRAPAGGRGEGRVLVMDDDHAIRDVAHAALTHLGYAVDVSMDGEEAIALYERSRVEGRPYDVVVLDLTVPGGLGGKQTIARLHRLDPGVRAIVASGYSNDPVISNFRAHGFCAAVEKPYDIDALATALASVLREPASR